MCQCVIAANKPNLETLQARRSDDAGDAHISLMQALAKMIREEGGDEQDHR